MVDAKAGVRIGLGCAVAAWGSAMLGTACGDANGLGEVWSLTAIDQAVCEKLIECGCGEAFAELDAPLPLSCEGWTLEIVPYSEEGYYYGYGYEGGYEGDSYDETLPASLDEDCIRRITQRIQAADCSLQFSALGSDCSDFCFPIVGPRFAGEECNSQEDCGRNLLCHRGECKDPCLAKDPAEGDPCDGGNDCGAGLYCSNEDGGDLGVCLGYPVAGQTCYFGDCAAGLRCDQNGGDEGTCVALTPADNPCMGHRECASGYCPGGYCAELPGAGQPCGADGACAPGAGCELDDEGGGTCVSYSNQCFDLFDDVLDLALLTGVNGYD